MEGERVSKFHDNSESYSKALITDPVPTSTVTAFYKGESQEKKQPRRLEGARLFAALSSPSCVESLQGFLSLQIHLVIVTAPSVSEARQAAWLKGVNHSSI
jgi:hypothetical protein